MKLKMLAVVVGVALLTVGIMELAFAFNSECNFGERHPFYFPCLILQEQQGTNERLDRVIELLEQNCYDTMLRENGHIKVWTCKNVEPPEEYADIARTGVELIENHGADRCEFYNWATDDKFFSSCTWWEGYFK